MVVIALMGSVSSTSVGVFSDSGVGAAAVSSTTGSAIDPASSPVSSAASSPVPPSLVGRMTTGATSSNGVGVPTIGGETNFDARYNDNILVNAMCVGLLREDDLIRAKAEGVGNILLAVGARTGRDGIHGASFASERRSMTSRTADSSSLIARPRWVF